MLCGDNSLNFSEFLLLGQLEKKAMKLSMQGTNRLTLKPADLVVEQPLATGQNFVFGAHSWEGLETAAPLAEQTLGAMWQCSQCVRWSFQRTRHEQPGLLASSQSPMALVRWERHWGNTALSNSRCYLCK